MWVYIFRGALYATSLLGIAEWFMPQTKIEHQTVIAETPLWEKIVWFVIVFGLLITGIYLLIKWLSTLL